MASEAKLQSAAFTWAWNEYPETRMCLFHIPNGEKRDKMTAMKLKAMGTVSGVFDLCFIWRGTTHFIESKLEGQKLSANQKRFKKAIEAQGAICHSYTTLTEFKELFLRLLEQNLSNECIEEEN